MPKSHPRQHTDWFRDVARAADRARRPAVRVPFEATTSGCGLYRAVLPLLYAHAGHDPGLASIQDPSVPPCEEEEEGEGGEAGG